MFKIHLFLFITLFFIASLHSSPIPVKRQAPTQQAPSGWKISWSKSGRISNGSSQNFISLITIDKSATTITQTHVNNCVQSCATTKSCGFVNLIKLINSSKGNVVCMLYPHYVDSGKAIYTDGPQNSGGTVNYSYGIRSLCTPTNGGSLTCTPSTVNPSTTTRTTSSSTPTPTSTSQSIPFYFPSDSTLPKPPSGATLVEWAPCGNSKLANPAMVNKEFIQGSSSNSAYIVQHGSGSDFDAYFTSLYQVVGESAPIISPGFLTNDGSSSYYRNGINLGYAPGIDTWTIGNNDVTGGSCSSFSQYDAILNYYNQNSVKFPNLNTIVIVGHSGGGNFVSRFSAINTNSPKTMRYVIANAANQAYFTNSRPNVVNNCDAAFSWSYQWSGLMNSYVSSRFSNSQSLFNQWSNRNVIHLTGDQDTNIDGTQTCQSLAQGGSARRDRNYAMWAYLNILAGTNTNVSQYYGYQQLLSSGAKKIGNGSLSHQACTVAGVGHDVDGMFQSSCGKIAILGGTLPTGAGASYP